MIKSDLWLTPNTPKHPIIDLTLAVLGEIDLDPCSNSGAPNIPAKHHYTAPEMPENPGGLFLPWHGRIFLHPPGSHTRNWVERFCFKYARGDIETGIALLKSAAIHSAETGRIIREHASAVCFWGAGWATPIKFLDPTTRQPSDHQKIDCALIYCGPDVTTFSAVFSQYGAVMQTIN